MGEFIKVASVTELEPGEGKSIEVNGERIALFNMDGRFYAIGDTCTHAEASLGEGELREFEVECPFHGACFDIRTGEAKTPPAVTPVETYDVKVSGNDIEIRVGK